MLWLHLAFSFLFAGIGANYHIMHLLMMLSWHVWSQPSTDPTESECTNGFPRCCKKQPQFHSNFTFILRNNAHQCWPSTNVYFAKQTVTVCSFIHRFQLFTKVQFTKACWTKLPRVVGKKEKNSFWIGNWNIMYRSIGWKNQ